jgi:hypothetical protein
LDGVPVDPHSIPLVDDGGAHKVRIVLGDPKFPSRPQPK